MLYKKCPLCGDGRTGGYLKELARSSLSAPLSMYIDHPLDLEIRPFLDEE